MTLLLYGALNKKIFKKYEEKSSKLSFTFCRRSIDVKTHQGGEIIFSFEQDNIDCQAFLLYTGSDGEKGGKGGKCGLGGPGGYGGTIIITKNPKVLKIVRDGDKGQDGNPGLNGNSGRSGWDMGYMDYSISIPMIEKWPKVKGNEKNRIKLETYDSSESDRIRCSYLKFLGKDGRFIKLEYLEIDHLKKDECEVEASTSQNNEKREYQVRAVRKKAILIDEVEEECFGLSEESALIRRCLEKK